MAQIQAPEAGVGGGELNWQRDRGRARPNPIHPCGESPASAPGRQSGGGDLVRAAFGKPEMRRSSRLEKSMQTDVFSLMPETMEPYLGAGVIGKARESGLIDIRLHDIRDYTTDRHRTADDEPYGGGGGMVLKPEPIFRAVETVLGEALEQVPIILLTPQGRVFNQKIAAELSRHPRWAIISGRYEGVDERVREHLATDEISVGDYVLTGGEVPALILIDAVARLVPGVLGDAGATSQDSHAEGLLEGPQYTRPAEFRGWEVPEVLRSGDHARIAAWRREQALKRTVERRPELLESADLTEDDLAHLERLEARAAAGLAEPRNKQGGEE